MTVIVGSTNPAKVNAVRTIFAGLDMNLEVRGVAAASGVPEQPLGVPQTTRGAINRARAALRDRDATWGVGLEGGVRFAGRAAWLFGVVAAVRPGAGVHTTRSAELRLPAFVAARLRAGEELGPIMDDVLGTVDIKKGVGTVGAFTRGLVTRPQVWSQAVALAIAPLITPELYDLR